MATLPVQKPNLAGTEVLDYAAATSGAGDKFRNSGKTMLHVKNASGSSVTVTFDSPNPCSLGVTGSAHDLAIPVPAGSDRLLGPFSPDRFNDANGDVTVTYSAVTSVTVAAIEQ